MNERGPFETIFPGPQVCGWWSCFSFGPKAAPVGAGPEPDGSRGDLSGGVGHDLCYNNLWPLEMTTEVTLQRVTLNDCPDTYFLHKSTNKLSKSQCFPGFFPHLSHLFKRHSSCQVLFHFLKIQISPLLCLTERKLNVTNKSFVFVT